MQNFSTAPCVPFQIPNVHGIALEYGGICKSDHGFGFSLGYDRAIGYFFGASFSYGNRLQLGETIRDLGGYWHNSHRCYLVKLHQPNNLLGRAISTAIDISILCPEIFNHANGEWGMRRLFFLYNIPTSKAAIADQMAKDIFAKYDLIMMDKRSSGNFWRISNEQHKQEHMTNVI